MDIYENMIEECGKRGYDPDRLLGLARTLPTMRFDGGSDTVPPKPILRVLPPLEEERKRVSGSRETAAEEARRIAARIAARLIAQRGSIKEAAFVAGIGVSTLGGVRSGRYAVSFENVIKMVRGAGLRLSIEGLEDAKEKAR